MWYWQRYRAERRRPPLSRVVRHTLLRVEKPARTRQRERWLRVGAVTLCLAAAALVLGLLAWGVNRLAAVLFYENERFVIRHLNLRSDGRLRADQIMEYAGLSLGTNLFAVDLKRVKRELESVPIVARVVVRRQLPDTLEVQVAERLPVARLGHESEGYPLAVDGEGHVLGPSGVSLRLPSITGYRTRGLRPGMILDEPALKSALELLELADEPVFNRFLRIRRIHLASEEHMDVYLDRGEQVRFPYQGMRRRLEQLCEIIKRSADEGRAIAFVDMTVQRNFPVVYREGLP